MVEMLSPPVLGEGAGPGSPPFRVIVVDDDRDTLLTLMMLLRDEGYDVKGASTAQQMWRELDTFAADAVLLDISLPDRNGYELAREICARYRDRRPALVAVTAWNKGADKLLARLAGFDRHVGKPYDPMAIAAILKSIRSDRAAGRPL